MFSQKIKQMETPIKREFFPIYIYPWNVKQLKQQSLKQMTQVIFAVNKL